MPAGDGAVRERTALSCQFCGADLEGSTTERVDEWNAYACHSCEAEARAAVPATCILRAFPRVESAETVAEGV